MAKGRFWGDKEDIERGGCKEKERGVQGQGWTETWDACRLAPALSSECRESEREGEICGSVFVEQGRR